MNAILKFGLAGALLIGLGACASPQLETDEAATQPISVILENPEAFNDQDSDTCLVANGAYETGGRAGFYRCTLPIPMPEASVLTMINVSGYALPPIQMDLLPPIQPKSRLERAKRLTTRSDARLISLMGFFSQSCAWINWVVSE